MVSKLNNSFPSEPQNYLAATVMVYKYGDGIHLTSFPDENAITYNFSGAADNLAELPWLWLEKQEYKRSSF